MTTTEHKRAPKSRAAEPSNLRLYLVALLATAYVWAWWLFGARLPNGDEPLAPGSLPEPGEAPRSEVWLHELAPSEQPVIVPPAGWHIAEQAPRDPSVSAPVRTVFTRVSPTRAGRIRTRSS